MGLVWTGFAGWARVDLVGCVGFLVLLDFLGFDSFGFKEKITRTKFENSEIIRTICVIFPRILVGKF